MTAVLKNEQMSAAEYLAFERESEIRHEFLDGNVYQMSGASEAHASICSNINISLGTQLKRRECKTYQSDLRVHIPLTGLFTYPDIVVVCGRPELLEDAFNDTLTNPSLIVEVLSPTTADYDKGAKFEHYRTIESFSEYLLVWQDKKRAARYRKMSDGSWVLNDFIGDQAVIELTSIECTLSMDDIYDKVAFQN